MNSFVMTLNQMGQKIARRAELIAAAVVIAIVFMLVLPLPLWLLDVLIAINLCVAGLMVVVSMYMAGPTAFSTFPTVLLMTTLFRLALEVATTRLILLEGSAGHIVETFGNFVVGGNLVVGLVIFVILTVVQFIVITKGSERVSEVAARFSLDAMPGKQMSIDSDLRAGILTADDAKKKRALLGMESQLHGAMDGAMKFVKGDAIAGIFIVAVNLVGGISIGVIQHGLTVSGAVQVYSILSIGDALIAQIPALLISLAAGMITTRVSKGGNNKDEEESNIGQDIAAELFSEPKALLTAAALMVMFGCIPGMPTLVFLGLALVLGASGVVGLMKPSADAELQRQAVESEKNNAKIVDLTTFTATRPFSVRMPPSLRDSQAADTLISAVRVMRNLMIDNKGIPDLQPISFEFHPSVPEGRVHFLMADVPLIDSPLRTGWAATTESLDRILEMGFVGSEDELNGTRRRRVWVKVDVAGLQAAGVKYMAWEQVFSADVEVEMLRNCQMFVGVHEVQRFTNWADRRYPELGKEIAKSVTLSRLTAVVQRLTREGVSLRNARQLLETTLEWAPKENDPDIIADHVRLAFKRQLCHEVARDGLIEVVLLSPELEDQLRSSLRESNQGSYLELDPEIEQSFLDRLGELSGTGGTPAAPPVLVTAADLRRSVRNLIEDEFFSVPVFAFSELTQHTRAHPIGMIEL
ncbi:type III secretion system export apparatus subunit SctV [Janthinobacterium agaricidamnosum]|uniref:Type III secretion, HrcV family protein n=1 Tax=Janthinobacterium agaricidamnosum NBRC 102515 = DSM 9628 TaxID=1349767 RepID=W0V4L0_9BURK|nr:type III secretion system export apparatus subunit SctV [Janthinobacterium agaricidamnosum]CDG82293.1 type III secretion, HrcV family protein [Janthinobacterium agaricidamnosum NBRC 102515 = DSM 9628]